MMASVESRPEWRRRKVDRSEKEQSRPERRWQDGQDGWGDDRILLRNLSSICTSKLFLYWQPSYPRPKGPTTVTRYCLCFSKLWLCKTCGDTRTHFGLLYSSPWITIRWHILPIYANIDRTSDFDGLRWEFKYWRERARSAGQHHKPIFVRMDKLTVAIELFSQYIHFIWYVCLSSLSFLTATRAGLRTFKRTQS